MSLSPRNRLDLRVDGAASTSSSQLRIQSDSHEREVQALNTTETIEPQEYIDTGATIVEGTVKLVIDQAEQAAVAIQDLRKEQLDIVNESQYRAYGDQTAAREAKAQDIQDQIEAIAQSKNAIGQDVLGSGVTYAVDDQFKNQHEAFAIPNASPLTISVNNIDNQTQENAEATASSIEDVLLGTTSLVSGIKATAAKATDKLTDPQPNPWNSEPDFNKPLSFEQAHELAMGIAQQIGSSYNSERQILKLIEISTRDLTQERADNLLSIG